MARYRFSKHVLPSSFYERRILPWLVHLAMRQRVLMEYRQRVVGAAAGNVLEIGVGSGPNLPLYGSEATRIVALDPSSKLLDMAGASAAPAGRRTALLQASAEAIPLADRSMDTVVTTWTLCSIPNAERALEEMRRVLAPGGRLLFVEHGRSPDAGVRRWQERLTPGWKRLAGGCHLDRPIAELIERAGFDIETLQTGYMRGPRVLAFMYEGVARPAA